MKRAIGVALLIILLLTGCSNKPERLSDTLEVYNAILIDDTFALESFFQEGFPPDYKDRNGLSLLEYSVLKDSRKSVALLLSKGVDPDKNRVIFKVKSFEVLKLLVKNSANINLKNREGTSVIVDFIKNKSARYSLYLIEKGVDIKTQDETGWTPLFWAGVSGEVSVLKKIIQVGGDPLSRDKEGNYPIYYANGEDKKIILLNYKYPLDEKNREGENILGEVYLKAVFLGEIKVIEILLEKGVDINYKSYGKGAKDILNETKNLKTKEFLERKGLK